MPEILYFNLKRDLHLLKGLGSLAFTNIPLLPGNRAVIGSNGSNVPSNGSDNGQIYDSNDPSDLGGPDGPDGPDGPSGPSGLIDDLQKFWFSWIFMLKKIKWFQNADNFMIFHF